MVSHQTAAVAALGVGLAVMLTWPLALHLQTALPYDLADPLLNTYILAWDADRLRHGLTGLWDAPFFYPYSMTLAWSEHLLGLAVFTAPVQWLTGEPVLAYNLAMLGSFALSGVGMFVLVRHLTGRVDAGLISAVAFAAAPYRIAHGSHLQMLVSGWMPIALWGIHAYFATHSRRALVVSVLAFVLQGLSNGYFLYFTTLAVVVVALGELLSRRGRSGTLDAPVSMNRTVSTLLVAAVSVVLAMLPVAWAYLSMQRETGFTRSIAEMRMFSASVDDYRRSPSQLAHWPGLLVGTSSEHSLFPGAVTALLALVAVSDVVRRPDRTTYSTRPAICKIYAALALVAAWLSMGPDHIGFRLLLTIVPGANGLRVPARLSVVVTLALCVLAGAGAVRVLGFCRSRSTRVILILMLGALIVRDGYAGPMPLRPFDAHQRARGGVDAWMRTQSSGAVLEWPIYSSHAGWERNLPAQIASLRHGRRVVNGYSGTGSALQDFLAGPGRDLRQPDEWVSLSEGLSRIGVRIVVRHDRTESGATGPLPSPGTPSYNDGRISAWALEPVAQLPEANGPLTPLRYGSTFVVKASPRPDRVVDMLDGNRNTRWLSGRAQRGDEVITLTLTPPRVVRELRMAVPVEMANYPRHLRIDVVLSDGQEVALFDGSVLPQVLHALAFKPRDPQMQWELPNQAVREIRLRQLGHTRTWHWQVPELELLAASESEGTQSGKMP